MEVLSTPVGTFGLRADQEMVAFDVFDVTADANADYKFPVERALVLRPVLPTHFKFTKLALVADLPANGFTWSDWCSDEFYAGTLWENEHKLLGTANFVDNGQLDEHAGISMLGLPSYEDVDERYRGQLVFQISYKPVAEYRQLEQQGINDLSIDFSFDGMLSYVS